MRSSSPCVPWLNGPVRTPNHGALSDCCTTSTTSGFPTQSIRRRRATPLKVCAGSLPRAYPNRCSEPSSGSEQAAAAPPGLIAGSLSGVFVLNESSGYTCRQALAGQCTSVSVDLGSQQVLATLRCTE